MSKAKKQKYPEVLIVVQENDGLDTYYVAYTEDNLPKEDSKAAVYLFDRAVEVVYDVDIKG